MMNLKIQFENDDLLVLEKPAGIVVIPTKKTEQVSLVSLLLQKRPAQKRLGEESRFGVVHRLDKNTSGLVLAAKTKEAFDYLTALFKNREIEKEYFSLVYGHVEKYGVIEKPLTKIGQRGISKVRVDDEGKPAKTEYWPLAYYVYRALTPLEVRRAKSTSAGALEHLTSNGVDSFTLLRVKLHTGRTHQIRVHFSSIRHPVMGDDLYGKPESQKLSDVLGRQFLHAAKLEFQLPDQTWLTVESELPQDLKKVLEKLNKVNAS